jgi:hypothetical protein
MLPAVVLMGVSHIAFPVTSFFFNCADETIIDDLPACPHRIFVSGEKAMCCAEQQYFSFGSSASLESETQECVWYDASTRSDCRFIYKGPTRYDCCLIENLSYDEWSTYFGEDDDFYYDDDPVFDLDNQLFRDKYGDKNSYRVA